MKFLLYRTTHKPITGLPNIKPVPGPNANRPYITEHYYTIEINTLAELLAVREFSDDHGEIVIGKVDDDDARWAPSKERWLCVEIYDGYRE